MLVFDLDWRFLEPRFGALRGVLSVAPPAPGDDGPPWLALRVPRNLSPKVLQGLRAQREALLLTSAMGQCVEDFWMESLYQHAHVAEMEHLDRAPPRFVIHLDELQTDAVVNWDRTLRHLLGHDDLSAGFFADLARLERVQRDEAGHRPRGAPRIPLRLRLDPPRRLAPGAQAAYLRGIGDLLRGLSDLERQAAARGDDDNPGAPRVPVFSVESVEMNLGPLAVTPANVLALQGVLAIDVRIRRLQLPSVVNLQIPECVPWRGAWASLLYTVCGHPLAPIVTPRPIEELVYGVREGPCRFTMFQALCSVLLGAQRLQHITFEHSVLGVEMLPNWKWLLVALFSRASAGRVSSVRIQDSLDVLAKCAEVIIAITTAEHPLLFLTEAGRIDFDQTTTSIVVPQGGMIHLQPGGPSDVAQVAEAEGKRFEVINGDLGSPHVEVLVPGFGRALVDRQATLEKRRRLDPAASPTSASVDRLELQRGVRSLGIECTTEATGVHILNVLLASVGRSLESLTLRVTGEDDNILRMIPEKCPRLRKLAIHGLTISTMDPILQAYENDWTVTSIRLVECELKDKSSMNDFLRTLTDPFATSSRRLVALHLGDKNLPTDMIDSDGAKLLARVVKENARLLHLEVIAPHGIVMDYKRHKRGINDEDDDGYDYEEDEDEDDEEMEIAKSFPLLCKCAFLSAIKESHYMSSVEDTGQTIAILSRVLKFAGSWVERRVIVETGKDSRM